MRVNYRILWFVVCVLTYASIGMTADVVETFNEACEKFNQGDYDAALKGFLSVLEVNPEDVDALIYVGLIYLNKKQYDQAIVSLEKAVKLKGDPQMLAVAWNNLGCALQAKDRLDEAINAYSEATRLNAKMSEAFFNLGNALLMKGVQAERLGDAKGAAEAYQQAVKAYEQVIALFSARLEQKVDEKHLVAAMKDALAMLSTSKYDQALERFRAIAMRRCDQPELHNNLGHCYMRLGARDKAIESFAQAVGLAPQRASYHADLGLALLELGRVSEAIPALEKAVKLGESSPDVSYALGLAYEQKGKIAEAETAYKRATELNPQFWDAHVALGELYERQKAFDKALNSYLLAAALKPQPSLFNNIGSLYFHQGKYNEAIQYFSKALKEDPNFVIARRNLAIAYREIKEYEKAASELREILKLQPENIGVKIELADVLIELKRYDEAMELCKDVSARDPKNAVVRVLLGFIHYTRGNLGLAWDEYKRATELDPKNADAWNGLGAVYERQGKLQDAEKCYRKALELDPKHEIARRNLERVKQRLEGG
ncbi:MAG: hypothetical protein RUDDFDWM_000381 [Candidatus Fervidibacterota bacterium]